KIVIRATDDCRELPFPYQKGYGYHSYLPGRCSWKKEYRIEATNFPSIHRLHPGKSFSASNAHQHYPESMWPALPPVASSLRHCMLHRHYPYLHLHLFVSLSCCRNPPSAMLLTQQPGTSMSCFSSVQSFLSINIEVRTNIGK